MKILLALGVLLCAGAGLAKSIRDASSSSGVVFCYYGSWANERPGVGRFGVSDIPLDLCTHIVYSFIGLEASGDLTYEFAVEETLEGKSNSVADLLALKESNTDLKILAAIGGYAEGSEDFSAVVNNDTLRAYFVSNLYNYIDFNGFDGLDLDWEYPAQRGGLETDKEQFVILVQELKTAFEEKGYLLTSAVAVTQSHIDLSYDVPKLSESLDYLNLMLYDFHGTWDTETGVNAPLYAQLTDSANLNLNANHSVNVWIQNGADPSKLVMGLGAYGRTFTLTSLNNTSTGASFTAAGVAGPYTQETGIWAYYEICEDQNNNPSEWSITEVDGSYVYANKDLFWVGYDNANTIYAKANYAKSMGMAGIMYWAVDLDDFSGLCGSKFPLIRSGIAGYNSAEIYSSSLSVTLLTVVIKFWQMFSQ